MSQATSPSTDKPYGLARVCRVWGIARSTIYWQRHERAMPAARRGPLGPCADDELVAHIRRILEASPFPGEGYRKVWARLRHRGIRTSPRRVLRLMRAHQLLAPTRPGLLTLCQPQFVKFLPHLHDWLTTNAAGIIAGAMMQHGHKNTQQSVANIA